MIGLVALAAAFPGSELPRYRVNDAFVYSDGRVERVVRVDRDRVVWKGLAGPSYARSRNFAVPVLEWRTGRGTGYRRIVGTPAQLWPLDRTRSARFRAIAEVRARPGGPVRRAVTMWTCRTQRPRVTTIGIGQFDTVPFSCDRYSATTMRLIERLEWDYAPALGHYVRRASTDYARGTRTTIELTAALSGPAASQRRLAALSRAARSASPARAVLQAPARKRD